MLQKREWVMDYNKKRLGIFVNKAKSILLLFLLFSLLWFLIFYAGNLPMEGYFLGTQIEGLFFLFIFPFLWVKSKKEVDRQTEEEDLKACVRRLEKEKDDLKGELDAYFLTWIHQIKTPITAAKLLSEELSISEEAFEEKEKIRMNLISIESYTNMALAYLKLVNTDRDFYIKSYNLDDILRPLLKRYSLFFIKNHISLNYKKCNQTLVTDSQWLGILIEQILSNAVKYTKEGSISIFYEKDRHCLTIKDTGIGIAKWDLPKIFNRGYSGFNGSLNEKSSGIGLFLAKKIADRLHYKLEVESVLGQGTSFRICISDEN